MLELRNLSFVINNDDGEEHQIIENINLTIGDGKFTVITGPNGGGKSTLAKLIMGIEHPTSGQIFFEGKDITSLSITDRAKMGLAYAFQQPPRFKGMTVRSLLSLASGRELPIDECCAYLTNVGLCSADYLNREVDSSLSGGEVKRIEIATLMARNLKLAIYDEPEAGIDLWSFSMLVDSFKAISKNKHESVLIISHQERIMQLADELIVLADGKIKEQGPKDQVFPTLLHQVDGENCGFRGGKA